jgi:trehalose synthase-fused probable maltokinase
MASKRWRSNRAAPPTPPALTRALGGFVAAAFPDFLPRQRWYRDKGQRLRSVSLVDAGPLGGAPLGGWLVLVEAAFAAAPSHLYSVFLRFGTDGAPGAGPGELTVAGRRLRALDAFDDAAFRLDLLRGFEQERTLATASGRIRFTRTPAFLRYAPHRLRESRRVGTEQSNTSVVYDDALVLKAFRRLDPGINPDCEMTGFLSTRTSFPHVPALAGTIEYAGDAGLRATVALLQHFRASEGDGWTVMLDRLGDFYAAAAAGDPGGAARPELVRQWSAGAFQAIRRLGAITAGLHAALASDPADPSFAPEPITPADAGSWRDEIHCQLESTLAELRRRLDILPEPGRAAALAVLAAETELGAALGDLTLLAAEGCRKIRTHGDYHLGQTLCAGDDFVILDFEGEPVRSLAERRAKHSPLRDVAGMLRSFDYAAAAALLRHADARPSERDRLEAWAWLWAATAAETFLAAYLPAVAEAPVRLAPRDRAVAERVLGALELDRALYEVRYEIESRPGWLPVPLRALGRTLAASRAAGSARR